MNCLCFGSSSGDDDKSKDTDKGKGKTPPTAGDGGGGSTDGSNKNTVKLGDLSSTASDGAPLLKQTPQLDVPLRSGTASSVASQQERQRNRFKATFPEHESIKARWFVDGNGIAFLFICVFA